tara:strand:- start:2553 stop:3122 length:570 start_codon:yes stop_codon:yes gene_type:complete
MLDEKYKEESKSLIKKLIDEGKMIQSEKNQINFFLDKSVESFSLAKRILKISEDEEDNLKSYMWVVSVSYYSMFFAGTALLAFFNHRIDEERGIHKLTYHALIYYFLVDDNKLQKHFMEEYKDAYTEAEELLKISESKAVSMIQDFDFEMAKRKKFTYEMGEIAELNKARTSVNRANEFLTEVRKIIGL